MHSTFKSIRDCIRFSKPAIVACLLGSGIAAQAQYVGPTSYTGFAGSPFSSVSFNYFHLENFEDGLLNTPGVSASAGVPVSFGSDSVSGGVWTYYSNGTNSLNFTFNAAALGGQLPTHVGLVWADVGIATPTYGFGNVQFEAFDATSTSLGVFGPFAVGDGSNAFGTAEDRFLGIVNAPGGIKSIRVTMPGSTDWELDHLQYGYVAVPEPSVFCLSLVGLAACFRRQRSAR